MDILAGEELCFSYPLGMADEVGFPGMPWALRHERQEYLKSCYDFVCKCELCSNGALGVESSLCLFCGGEVRPRQGDAACEACGHALGGLPGAKEAMQMQKIALLWSSSKHENTADSITATIRVKLLALKTVLAGTLHPANLVTYQANAVLLDVLRNSLNQERNKNSGDSNNISSTADAGTLETLVGEGVSACKQMLRACDTWDPKDNLMRQAVLDELASLSRPPGAVSMDSPKVRTITLMQAHLRIPATPTQHCQQSISFRHKHSSNAAPPHPPLETHVCWEHISAENTCGTPSVQELQTRKRKREGNQYSPRCSCGDSSRSSWSIPYLELTDAAKAEQFLKGEAYGNDEDACLSRVIMQYGADSVEAMLLLLCH